jgi:hypothetical protein
MAKKLLKPLPDYPDGDLLFITTGRQNGHLNVVKQHQQLGDGIADKRGLIPAVKHLA